jgi:hypothetical protein
MQRTTLRAAGDAARYKNWKEGARMPAERFEALDRLSDLSARLETVKILPMASHHKGTPCWQCYRSSLGSCAIARNVLAVRLPDVYQTRTLGPTANPSHHRCFLPSRTHPALLASDIDEYGNFVTT